VFPGYVFVLAEHFARLEVFRSHAAVQLLPVPNPAALYHDLSHLFRTLVARPSAVEESLYQPGVRVEVVSGPLAGVEGELIRSRQGGTRLLVAVRLFERGITVDIDAAHVRRL
jgi:transcription antitermination factor NusG